MAKRKVQRRLKKKYRILLTVLLILAAAALLVLAVKAVANAPGPEYGDIMDGVETTEDPQESGLILEGERGDDYAMGTVPFTFTVLDVGQGQSIFIDYGETEVLIDGGLPEYGDSVVDKIGDQIDGNLDYVIATHCDADHVGGLSSVYSAFAVGKTIYGNLSNSETSRIFMQDAKRASNSFENDTDTTIELGKNATLTIFDVTDNEEDSNDNSVLTLIQYGETSFFASGDAGSDVEKKLRGKLPACDVVVAGHHGSSTSNSLLDILQPDYFIISAGENNEYGHPHKEVLQYALEKGAAVYGTWKSGDITFTSDGMSVSCSAETEQELSILDVGAKSEKKAS